MEFVTFLTLVVIIFLATWIIIKRLVVNRDLLEKILESDNHTKMLLEQVYRLKKENQHLTVKYKTAKRTLYAKNKSSLNDSYKFIEQRDQLWDGVRDVQKGLIGIKKLFVVGTENE